jgi:hypothetical protein
MKLRLPSPQCSPIAITYKRVGVIPEMRVSIAGIALAIIQAFEQRANSCDMNLATMSGTSSGR